jgi:hypothetical protein
MVIEVNVIGRADLGSVTLPVKWKPACCRDDMRNRTVDGYTTRRGVPCGFVLFIAGRWRRPRVVQYSNAGTALIRSPRYVATLALGSVMVPNGKASSAEDIRSWEARIIRAKDA